MCNRREDVRQTSCKNLLQYLFHPLVSIPSIPLLITLKRLESRDGKIISSDWWLINICIYNQAHCSLIGWEQIMWQDAALWLVNLMITCEYLQPSFQLTTLVNQSNMSEPQRYINTTLQPKYKVSNHHSLKALNNLFKLAKTAPEFYHPIMQSDVKQRWSVS